MGEMTKKPTVPAIRFKGFTDTWEQRKFSELTEIRSASRVHKEEWKSSGVPFYRSSDVMAALNGTENEKAFISEELYEKLTAVSGKLEKGDVLVTGGGSVGKPYIVANNEPLYTKDADLLWIKNNEYLDPYFVYTFFFSQTFTDYLNSVSHVGTIAHYTITQLGETPITLPCVSEQQKIGDYFRNLDSLITLHQRKLDKLHKVKRSLLERMFPRNGANVPEIRFSGFTDAWEQCELGAIIQAVQELTSDFENYPLYSLTIENGVTPKTERYERSFLITKETDLFKIVPEQCFVSNPMNLRFGAIGFNDSGKKVSVSGYYDVFSIDRGECSNFWCVYLKTANSLKRFDDVAIGSLIEKRRVHFSQLTEMSFPAPNMNEKKKLGEFFERLERLITLHQRKSTLSIIA